jgi:hypothetical protein
VEISVGLHHRAIITNETFSIVKKNMDIESYDISRLTSKFNIVSL